MIHEHQIEKLRGRLFTKEELEKEANLATLIAGIREKIDDKVKQHFEKTDQDFTYVEQVTDNWGILVRVSRDKDRERLYYFYYFKHRTPYREYYFYKEERQE